MSDPPDKSNGYEQIAPMYIAGRGKRVRTFVVGVAQVTAWAEKLPARATVLDLGCGTGDPITRIFVDLGFNVYAVDASPSMVEAFHERFADVPVECAAAEESAFFGRTFDAVVGWGLFFLLDADAQRKLIANIAGALRRDGRLLFTATRQSCSWNDAMTGRPSVSLGEDGYRNAIEAAGLTLLGTAIDEGDNYYYFAEK